MMIKMFSEITLSGEIHIGGLLIWFVSMYRMNIESIHFVYSHNGISRRGAINIVI